MSSSEKGKLHFLVTSSALGTTSSAGICFSDFWYPELPAVCPQLVFLPSRGLAEAASFELHLTTA